MYHWKDTLLNKIPQTDRNGLTSLVASAGEMHFSTRLWWYVLTAALGVLGFLAEPEGGVAFVVLTAVLTVFVGVECYGRAQVGGARWLIEAPVWTSIITFGLVYGATNVLYFLPDSELEPLGLVAEVTPAMNKLMAMAVVASVAMWLGFNLQLGGWIGKFLRELVGPIVRTKNHISIPWAVFFVLVSIYSRYQLIALGVFGYSSSFEALTEAANVREYLEIGGSLGLVVLVSMSIAYFETRHKGMLVVLAAIFTYETAAAFLLGFKARVLVPVLIVGCSYLIVNRRFPRWLLPSIVIGLFFAYAIIEPFRQIRMSDASFESTSLGSIAGTVVNAAIGAVDGTEQTTNNTGFAIPVLGRANITYIASLGVEYMDEGNELPDDAPSFLMDVLLAPLHAVVPRFVWESKPTQALGQWYVTEVMGVDLATSVGMGPITYLYIGGGILAVFLGFLLVGIVQRSMLVSLYQSGGGGIVCYVLLLPALSIIDSSFNTFITSVVRYGIVYVGLQWLLLRR